MYRINENYLKLPGSYLFSTIGKKVSAFSAANPDKRIIRLGIGDVTQPLPGAVVEALHRAVDEMADADTFHGYAPDLGYEFLRKAIAAARLNRMRFLFLTGRSRILPIFRKFLRRTVNLRCVIRCILCMWILM